MDTDQRIQELADRAIRQAEQSRLSLTKSTDAGTYAAGAFLNAIRWGEQAVEDNALAALYELIVKWSSSGRLSLTDRARIIYNSRRDALLSGIMIPTSSGTIARAVMQVDQAATVRFIDELGPVLKEADLIAGSAGRGGGAP